MNAAGEVLLGVLFAIYGIGVIMIGFVAITWPGWLVAYWLIAGGR